MNDNKKFEYVYNAPTEEERREIEDIRKRVVSEDQPKGKLDRLRTLNNAVYRPPLIIAWIMGVMGVLIMGTGLTMVLEWRVFFWGIVVGLSGCAVAACAYPVFKRTIKRNKRKYGEEIIKLSDELLNK